MRRIYTAQPAPAREVGPSVKLTLRLAPLPQDTAPEQAPAPPPPPPQRAPVIYWLGAGHGADLVTDDGPSYWYGTPTTLPLTTWFVFGDISQSDFEIAAISVSAAPPTHWSVRALYAGEWQAYPASSLVDHGDWILIHIEESGEMPEEIEVTAHYDDGTTSNTLRMTVRIFWA
mgnify:CR=1 FL=1